MKKVLSFVVFAVGMLTASADYLYWMVADEYINTAESASLYAVYNGDATVIDGPKNSTEIQAVGAFEPDSVEGSFAASLGTSMGEGWSYYIEIVNAGKTLQSEAITYSSASTQGMIGDLFHPATFANGAFGTGPQTYNVPEPTSGLLFLVGGMLLGLRRKRRV